MQRLVMANIENDGRITQISENVSGSSNFSIIPIQLGNDTVLEIYDNDTKLSNLLDENMQVVFDFWFRKVTTLDSSCCLIIDVPDKGLNMILPNKSLAFEEETANILRYYPAASGMIFFFTKEGSLIAYNLYLKSEIYKVKNVKCDDSFQTINYNYTNFKYFYYIDSTDNNGKIIDITTGKCILEYVPKAESMKILYMSETAFLISFRGDKNENWLVSTKTGQSLVIIEDSINVAFEFEYNNDSYIVIEDLAHLTKFEYSKNLIVKITPSGNIAPLIQAWLYNFFFISIDNEKRFISYYENSLYESLSQTIFDLKTHKKVIDNCYALLSANNTIFNVIINLDASSERHGALFSVAKTKLITDPKKLNITDFYETNDEDILVVKLDNAKSALFSISKEGFISDKFDEIGENFNHKGFIKVKNSKGKKNKIDKNGNLVNDEWI